MASTLRVDNFVKPKQRKRTGEYTMSNPLYKRGDIVQYYTKEVRGVCDVEYNNDTWSYKVSGGPGEDVWYFESDLTNVEWLGNVDKTRAEMSFDAYLTYREDELLAQQKLESALKVIDEARNKLVDEHNQDVCLSSTLRLSADIISESNARIDFKPSFLYEVADKIERLEYLEYLGTD